MSPTNPDRTQPTPGFTIVEAVILLIVLTVLAAVAIPALGGLRNSENIDISMSNLIALSVAHSIYAGDYNGGQYTTTPHDLASYGSSYPGALSNWSDATGEDATIVLGWSQFGIVIGAPAWVIANSTRLPLGGLGLGPNTHFGSFRVDNIQAFNPYVAGTFYSPEFYAPNDTPIYNIVEPAFSEPWGVFNFGDGPGAVTVYWPSYVRSPAAMLDPAVLAAPSAGGAMVNPWAFDAAFNAPPSNHAQFPDLKTHIIEHHWNQSPPEPCNPAFGDQGSYDGCEPYYFNHGLDSTPVAAFYDGHVRLLPNAEVFASDEMVLRQTRGVDGLWSRDTAFGSGGYLGEAGVPGEPMISHHILTTDGILGRDTLGPHMAPRR